MICNHCSQDVHPVQEMTGSGSFFSKCPTSGCGAPLTVEPTTIAPSRASVIASIEDDLERLRDSTAEIKDKPQMIDALERRLRRLQRKSAAPVVQVAPAPTPALQAPPPVAPSQATPTLVIAGDDDIVNFMRARLQTIEAQKQKLDQEARKIRAMLAVADATP